MATHLKFGPKLFKLFILNMTFFLSNFEKRITNTYVKGEVNWKVISWYLISSTCVIMILYVSKDSQVMIHVKNLVFLWICNKTFWEIWLPRQNLYLLTKDACLLKAEYIKCYPNKIDNYDIKTYKLVDSGNNYCLTFDIFTGITHYLLTV